MKNPPEWIRICPTSGRRAVVHCYKAWVWLLVCYSTVSRFHAHIWFTPQMQSTPSAQRWICYTIVIRTTLRSAVRWSSGRVRTLTPRCRSSLPWVWSEIRSSRVQISDISRTVYGRRIVASSCVKKLSSENTVALKCIRHPRTLSAPPAGSPQMTIMSSRSSRMFTGVFRSLPHDIPDKPMLAR